MLKQRASLHSWQILAALATGGILALVLIPMARIHGPSPRGVVLERVLDKVSASFVEDLAPERLDQAFHEGLDHMVRQLDRNTRYISPHRARDFEGDTEGSYIGIGVVLSPPDPLLPRITNVIAGGPAALAGLRKGDVLEAIGDVSLAGSTMEAINELIRGEPGTRLSVRVVREDQPAMTLLVWRDKVETSSLGAVRIYPASGTRPTTVGYVRIHQFQDRTGDDLNQACSDLRYQGASALVLDLRGNGGGVLQQAVQVAGLFTAPSHLLTTRGRSDLDRPRLYSTDSPGPYLSWPLVVLIDGGSASASEIVSAALRDHERALLVGTESYGKWTVQTIYRLGNQGEDGLLKLTTRRYYPPLGLGIRRDPADGHRLGLQPDVEVKLSEEAARRLHELWQREQIDRVDDAGRVQVQALEPAAREPVDLPLVRALELLRDPIGHRQLVADQRLRWLAEAAATPHDPIAEVAASQEDGEPQPSSGQ